MSSWGTSGNLTGTLSVGQGEPGKSLEYEWRETWLGIRREGEAEYQFVNLGAVAGREIELQVGSGYLQWRYKGEEEWKNLISIDSLKGEPGPQGLPGKDGVNGINGADGKSLDFNWNGTELGVKKEGQTSYSYVNLKGKDGKDGKNGIDGTNGQDGADGVTPNIQVGTVTTLEPGEKATVTKRGTKEEPIFDFGIPRGEKGENGTGIGGTGGSSGKKLIARYVHNSNKVIQPTALDLETGVFTCENHRLTGNERLMINLDVEKFSKVTFLPKELFLAFYCDTWKNLKPEVINKDEFRLKNVSYNTSVNTEVDVSKFWFETIGIDSIKLNNILPIDHKGDIQILTSGLNANNYGIELACINNSIVDTTHLKIDNKVSLIPIEGREAFIAKKTANLNIFCYTNTIIKNNYITTNVIKSTILLQEDYYRSNWLRPINDAYSFGQIISGDVKYKETFTLGVLGRQNIRNGFTIEIYDLGVSNNES